MTPPPAADVPTLDGRPLELFEPPCPSCGGTGRRAVARPRAHNRRIGGRFTEVACGGCGMVYVCPRPTGPELGRCYGVLSPGGAGVPVGRGPLGWLRARWRRMNGQDVALDYVGPGPALDVGCNHGELLLRLRAAGLEAEGLEFNPVGVAACRARGFTTYEGDVTATPLPEGRYGTVVLAHTLEHLTDPVGDLRKLARSLVAGPQSRIVIVVPHADSPARRRFGDDWHGWDPPFHICHYTAATLAGVAGRAGLRLHRHRVRFVPEDFTRSKALATGRESRNLALRLALLPPMKLLQQFGYGSVLIADLRPGPTPP